MANSYSCTDGSRITQATLDREIRKAKEAFLKTVEGFCSGCGETQGRLDCSHTISVKRCKENV